jgi:hypothetical protein
MYHGDDLAGVLAVCTSCYLRLSECTCGFSPLRREEDEEVEEEKPAAIAILCIKCIKCNFEDCRCEDICQRCGLTWCPCVDDNSEKAAEASGGSSSVVAAVAAEPVVAPSGVVAQEALVADVLTDLFEDLDDTEAAGLILRDEPASGSSSSSAVVVQEVAPVAAVVVQEVDLSEVKIKSEVIDLISDSEEEAGAGAGAGKKRKAPQKAKKAPAVYYDSDADDDDFEDPPSKARKYDSKERKLRTNYVKSGDITMAARHAALFAQAVTMVEGRGGYMERGLLGKLLARKEALFPYLQDKTTPDDREHLIRNTWQCSRKYNAWNGVVYYTSKGLAPAPLAGEAGLRLIKKDQFYVKLVKAGEEEEEGNEE